MTRIEFRTHIADKIGYTCRLVRKALSSAPESKIILFSTDKALLNRLDEMLWRFHAFHRRRLRFVAEILARDTGEYARPVLPGSFGCVWLHFDAADIGALYRARRGIDFQPGWFYGESARSCRHVLIRYTMPEAVFEEGMARFGALCRSVLG